MIDSNTFWHFDIGNVVTWATVIIAAIVWFLKYNRRLDTMERLGVDNAAGLKELAKMVGDINSNGTQWSQRGISLETELTKSNSRRLDAFEALTGKIMPELAAISADLHWIKIDIQQRRAHQKHLAQS